MGGAERMMVHTANELSDTARISFISLTGGDDLRPELRGSIRVVSLGKKKSLSAIPALLKFIRKEKPDVLISTQIHVNLIAVLMKVLFRTKTKIILREATSAGSQFMIYRDMKSRLVKTAVRLLYPRADAVVAICEAVKHNLVEHHFIKPSQASVIYNPVLNGYFREGIKHDAGHAFFHAGVPVIVSVGRLAPLKNFTLLIEAFALLEKNLDARLIIIGEGEEREKLSVLIRKYKLEEKIFLAGKIINPYPFVKKSSVYALTSLFEGLPNALIEAMACGIQLVSVDCPGGSAEVLMNGKLGRLVEMNNPQALATAIREVCRNPVDKSVLMESANRFEAHRTGAAYIKLIQGLVE